MRLLPRWLFACLMLSLALTGCGAESTAVPPTAPLPTHTPPPITATPDPVAAELDEAMRAITGRGRFSGAVLAARDGRVLLSRGYGLADEAAGLPNTSQTRFRLASLTKQFTAAAVLLLQEDGRLGVDDTVCQYVPDCPAGWEAITIHQLLTHTAGLPDITRFPEFRAISQQSFTPLELTALIQSKPLTFSPGERWAYSNSGYIVLGAVIEAAAGRPYAAYLQEAVFAPLGMADSGYEDGDSELATGYRGDVIAEPVDMSIPYAAGALYSTVEDMYRWERALGDGRLLSPASLAAMFAAQPGTSGRDGEGYGYGWVIGQENGRRLARHAGSIEGFASAILRYPDEDVTVIVLSNQQQADAPNLAAELARRVFTSTER